MDAKGAQALVERLALEQQRRAAFDETATELSSRKPSAASAPDARMPPPAATRRSRQLRWWPRRGG